MEVQDNLNNIEQYVVASTIPREKKVMFEAWISGEEDLPRELTSRHEAPGLAPCYKFSARVCTKAEELSREADISTLKRRHHRPRDPTGGKLADGSRVQHKEDQV